MTERTPESPERFQSRPFHRLGPALVALSLSVGSGCDRKGEPQEAPPTPPPAVDISPAPAESPPPAPAPEPESEPVAETQGADPDGPPPPHPGPWFWVTRVSAGIYTEPRAERSAKLGYVQRGGKLPVLAEKVEGGDCSKGWYRIVGGGYICALVGTTDENDRAVKFAPRQPKLDDILPYPYARNAHNGTPLYRSLPSKAQMLEYEPYLAAKSKSTSKQDPAPSKDVVVKTNDATASDADRAAKSNEPDGAQAIDVATAASGMPAPQEKAEEPPKPWWQQEDVKDRLHEIKLEQLAEEADGVLAKRMVKGFYVAVDSTFKWGGRNWYKTTKGLLAPTERFWQAAGSKFQGVEIDGETWKLPIAWVYGGRKSSTTYTIDPENKRVTPKGSVEKFKPIQLTGKQLELNKRTYHELADGTWIRDDQVRVTTPEPRPADVGENERWIDVDLSEQTLVAFQGNRPVYATLVSSGKESKIKAKDHRTPRGSWRVREKHLTATMDGDGSAAGDLPYSIEDVPYVMYYHKSYALHAAFWHENYGSQMSHGCVNLAPLDAKYLFFWADPQIPEGWHGMWSDDAHPGSLIVAHD
jgi:lipoprotein-anchoring transpeptidase ErfK/SrfK